MFSIDFLPVGNKLQFYKIVFMLTYIVVLSLSTIAMKSSIGH